MGNICSDNQFTQLKQLHPKEFQKFIEVNELEKQVTSNYESTQGKLNTQITKIESQQLSSVDAKKNQVKDHFEKVKEQVNKYYPGGVTFLQKGKKEKIQDLLGYSLAQKQYTDIKQMVQKKFAVQKETANKKLQTVKEEELKTLQTSKPSVDSFKVLTDKSDAYTQGLKQFKSQIDAKSKELTDSFNKKIGLDGLLESVKNVVPTEKLESLTKDTKQQISRNATNFIGHPNQGKVKLGQ